MFGWIPILGPIIDGIVSIWKGAQNVEVVKYTTDGKVDIAAMQASNAIIQSTKDDIGIRILRDMALTPAIVWLMLVGWDTIMAEHWPSSMWHVASWPPSISYYPGLALGFLLGNIGLNIFRLR